jgi:hypothetical protein
MSVIYLMRLGSIRCAEAVNSQDSMSLDSFSISSCPAVVLAWQRLKENKPTKQQKPAKAGITNPVKVMKT